VLEIKRSLLDVVFQESLDTIPEIAVNTLPHVVDAHVLQQGKIQMAKLPHGPRVEFTMDGEDHEKAIFAQPTIKMFEQPPLETWAIFGLQVDEKLVRSFCETLKDSVNTFGLFSKEPKVVLIKSKSYAEWDEVLREHLTPQVQAVILVIPGRKGQSNPLYEDLKKLLIKDIPIPSQMILA
jgi:vacuolar-type H+-ATPase subunit F/Vma7